ncbi:zinc knuckle CX2CX4HX4C containing protein [Tanacetum coccineum]
MQSKTELTLEQTQQGVSDEVLPLRDGWTYFLREPSIPGISLRKPLSKGIVHHQRLPRSLKKSPTSSRKDMKHYTKLGNDIMTFYINASPMTSITIRRGAHLNKDCPLKEEVKSIEEAKYGKFGRHSPFSNGAKYCVGPPGYYIRMENRPPVREKRPSLEELMNKHLEESTRRRTEMEE